MFTIAHLVKCVMTFDLSDLGSYEGQEKGGPFPPYLWKGVRCYPRENCKTNAHFDAFFTFCDSLIHHQFSSDIFGNSDRFAIWQMWETERDFMYFSVKPSPVYTAASVTGIQRPQYTDGRIQ